MKLLPAIVVPTVRKESLKLFLEKWNRLKGLADLIIIEDNPNKTFDVPADTVHYAWSDIDADLMAESWIIPRRTDCVRSYGYLKAWQAGYQVIGTLDDDCYPTENFPPEKFVQTHMENLKNPTDSVAWASTVTGPWPRGMPYFNTNRKVECWLSHGLWENVPDFDAATQLVQHRRMYTTMPIKQFVPRGIYTPLCGMNAWWRKDLTPAMWFLLMGSHSHWPYDRLGDIWAGVMAKRIMDHLGLGMYSGLPAVWHDRASNVWANLRKEAPGMEANENFWQMVDCVVLTKTTITGCYKELADKLPMEDSYGQQLRRGMHIWADLFHNVHT